MSRKDLWKVLLMLGAAFAVVALYCYARVDLGMSAEQVNAKLGSLANTLGGWVLVVWTVIVVGAVGAGVSHWLRTRAEDNSADALANKAAGEVATTGQYIAFVVAPIVLLIATMVVVVWAVLFR